MDTRLPVERAQGLQVHPARTRHIHPCHRAFDDVNGTGRDAKYSRPPPVRAVNTRSRIPMRAVARWEEGRHIAVHETDGRSVAVIFDAHQ